jgi:hypothetical protein
MLDPFCQVRDNRRNQRDTSKFMILVWFLDLKFLFGLAATIEGTSDPPHRR